MKTGELYTRTMDKVHRFIKVFPPGTMKDIHAYPTFHHLYDRQSVSADW